MSRKKTQNKTNSILEDISKRFHLVDDDAIGAFFGVIGSTVSSWRVRDCIPNRYIEHLKTKTLVDEKQNMFMPDTISTISHLSEQKPEYEKPCEKNTAQEAVPVCHDKHHPGEAVLYEIKELLASQKNTTFDLLLRALMDRQEAQGKALQGLQDICKDLHSHLQKLNETLDEINRRMYKAAEDGDVKSLGFPREAVR
jgi:hypothetical protein